MISAHHLQKNSSAILVSPGFTENEVVYCLSQMRALGLPILLVGISTSLVKSQRGLSVAPDLVLSELANGQFFKMLIIPGSYECVTNLLTSPDFHVQVNRSLAGDGRVEMACDPWHKVPSPFVYRIEDVMACWRQVTAPTLMVLAEQGYVTERFGDDAAELPPTPPAPRRRCLQGSSPGVQRPRTPA